MTPIIAYSCSLPKVEDITAILNLRILKLSREQNDRSRGLTFENFKGIKVSPEDMMIEYADLASLD